jgi:biopolymer transport protein ExbD/biopolymer transport protein TolR
MQVGHAGKILNEINITPLTDIFLVLLIIMMVVAPMMRNSNQSIHPPALTAGESLDPNRVTVEVTADGKFFVEGKEVSEETLTSSIKAEAPRFKEKNIIVRADKTTRSSAIMKVFNAARDASFEKVTIAGSPISEQRHQALEQANPASAAPADEPAPSLPNIPASAQ